MFKPNLQEFLQNWRTTRGKSKPFIIEIKPACWKKKTKKKACTARKYFRIYILGIGTQGVASESEGKMHNLLKSRNDDVAKLTLSLIKIRRKG